MIFLKYNEQKKAEIPSLETTVSDFNTVKMTAFALLKIAQVLKADNTNLWLLNSGSGYP